MKDSATNIVTMTCAIISTSIIVWQQATGVPANWVTYLVTFVAGFGLGFSVRYFIFKQREKECNETVAAAERDRDRAEAEAEAERQRADDYLWKMTEAEATAKVQAEKLAENGLAYSKEELAGAIAAAMKADREDNCGWEGLTLADLPGWDEDDGMGAQGGK